MFDNLPPLPEWMIDDEKIVSESELREAKVYAQRRVEHDTLTVAQQQSLAALITELPPTDTVLHIIGGASWGTGDNSEMFEFGHFIPVLIKLLGGAVDTLYVSTWTMNRQSADGILALLDSGAVKSVGVLTDGYFLTREAHFARTFFDGLRAHGQRMKLFKNHAKIVAMSSPSGCVVVQGSANMNARHRAENWTLTTDRSVYEWVRDEFFIPMLK